MKKEFVLETNGWTKTIVVKIPPSQIGVSNLIAVCGNEPIFMGRDFDKELVVSQIRNEIDWDSDDEVLLRCSGSLSPDFLKFRPSQMDYANCDIRICETIMWTAVDYTHQFFADEAVK